MSCIHRFLGYHIENSLFSDWDIDTLIIGTFNPIWNFNNSNSAQYFYGRTKNNYFWDVLPLTLNQKGLRINSADDWIDFLKKNKIGLTDLVLNIIDADNKNNDHYCLLKSMSDKNIAKFKNIDFNTLNIINFLEHKKIKQVFITNQTSPKVFETEISIIKSYCKTKEIHFERLLTPSSGARFKLKKGTKIIDGILNDWKLKFKNENE